MDPDQISPDRGNLRPASSVDARAKSKAAGTPVVQFAVVMKGSEWAVLRDGQVIESGLSRSEAIKQAEQLAFDAEESGEVEILVQEYAGELKTRYSGTDGGRP